MRRKPKTRIVDDYVEEWRSCAELLIWSAPIEFSSYMPWMKAVMRAEKLAKKYANLENNNLENNNDKD